MERSISIRLDDLAHEALKSLRSLGQNQSEVVREALVELARRRQRTNLAVEARRLAADTDDKAEMAALAELMESLRAAG